MQTNNQIGINFVYKLLWFFLLALLTRFEHPQFHRAGLGVLFVRIERQMHKIEMSHVYFLVRGAS